MAKQKKDFIDFLDGVSSFIETNFRGIALFLGIIAVGGVGYTVYKKKEAATEKSAFEKLYEIEAVYASKKDGFDKAKALVEEQKKAKTDKKKALADEKLAAATGDITKDYGQVVSNLENFVNSNSKTQAAIQGALYLSEIYEEYKVPEKAAAILEAATAGKKSGLLYGIASMRAGSFWAKTGKCEKAVTHWEAVSSKKYPYFQNEAILKTALCMHKMGQTGAAKSRLQDLVKNNPQAQEASSAKKYLKLFEFLSAKKGTDANGS